MGEEQSMSPIDDFIGDAPLEALYKISQFESPTNCWSLQEVAYALKQIYDKLKPPPYVEIDNYK